MVYAISLSLLVISKAYSIFCSLNAPNVLIRIPVLYKSKIAMLSRNPEYVDLSKSDNNTVNSFSVAASLTLVFTFILMFLQNFELSNHYRDNSLLISWRYSTLVTSTKRLKL